MYASVTNLAEHLRIPDAMDDSSLEVALQAAKAQIDEWCRRTFDPVNPDTDTATERVYTVRGYDVFTDDLVDVDSVELDGSVVEDFELEPVNNPALGRPYQQLVFPTRLSGKVTVTGWFGWPALPAPVKQAAILQAARLSQRRNAQFGVATVPGLDGSGMRLLAKLDADVELLLAPYRKNPVLV
jgi:hypothetical protein